MRRALSAGRLTVGLILILATVAVIAVQPAEAHRVKARITIHKLICPENTRDLFGKCHHKRLVGVAFTVKKQTKEIEPNGEEVWRRNPGRTPITEDPAVFDDFVGAYVYCSELNSGAVLFNSRIWTNTVIIWTWSGANIVCDWYNLTKAK